MLYSHEIIFYLQWIVRSVQKSQVTNKEFQKCLIYHFHYIDSQEPFSTTFGNWLHRLKLCIFHRVSIPSNQYLYAQWRAVNIYEEFPISQFNWGLQTEVNTVVKHFFWEIHFHNKQIVLFEEMIVLIHSLPVTIP